MYNLVAVKGKSRMVISGHIGYESVLMYMDKIYKGKHYDSLELKKDGDTLKKMLKTA